MNKLNAQTCESWLSARDLHTNVMKDDTAFTNYYVELECVQQETKQWIGLFFTPVWIRSVFFYETKICNGVGPISAFFFFNLRCSNGCYQVHASAEARQVMTTCVFQISGVFEVIACRHPESEFEVYHPVNYENKIHDTFSWTLMFKSYFFAFRCFCFRDTLNARPSKFV